MHEATKVVGRLAQDEPRQMSLEKLLEGIAHLERISDRDDECDCFDDRSQCTDERPHCDLRRARAALRAINNAFEFTIRSTWPERLTNYPEWVFLERFKEENKRDRCINHGHRMLELLLGHPERRRSAVGGMVSDTVPEIVTQRDADVASTVIQWLGTSCGIGFLSECERQIAQARWSESETTRARYKYLVNNRNPPAPDDPIAFEAERMAVEFDPESKLKGRMGHSLRQSIESVIRRFSHPETEDTIKKLRERLHEAEQQVQQNRDAAHRDVKRYHRCRELGVAFPDGARIISGIELDTKVDSMIGGSL